MIPELTFEYLLGAVPIGGKANIYFGSVALKENSGVFDDQFRYKLTVVVPEEGENEVSALYYIGWQSYDNADKEQMTEKRFAADDEGAAAACAWLREELAKYTKE